MATGWDVFLMSSFAERCLPKPIVFSALHISVDGVERHDLPTQDQVIHRLWTN